MKLRVGAEAGGRGIQGSSTPAEPLLARWHATARGKGFKGQRPKPRMASPGPEVANVRGPPSGVGWRLRRLINICYHTKKVVQGGWGCPLLGPREQMRGFLAQSSPQNCLRLPWLFQAILHWPKPVRGGGDPHLESKPANELERANNKGVDRCNHAPEGPVPVLPLQPGHVLEVHDKEP